MEQLICKAEEADIVPRAYMVKKQARDEKRKNVKRPRGRIKQCMNFYNGERFHASHDYQAPDQTYESRFQIAETVLRAVV